MSWWDESVDRLVPTWASPPLISLLSLTMCLLTYLLAQVWFQGRLALATSATLSSSSPMVVVFWLSPLDSALGSTITPASVGQLPPPPPAPSLLYLFIALCFFIHHTFDRVELRQARRLRFCSPVADFFSHVCLSLASLLLLLLLANALQLSPDSFASPLLLFTCLLAVHLLAYQHYLFGEPPAVVATLLSSVRPIMTVISLITCLFGEGIWLQEVAGLRINAIISLAATLFFLLLLVDFARRVTSHSRTADIPLRRILTALGPHCGLIVCSCLWLLVDFHFLMEEAFHLVVLAVGLLHCFLVARLFVDRSTKQQFQVNVNACVVLPVVICLLAYLAPLSGYDIEPLLEPHHLVQLCLALAAINYAQFVGQIIYQMSSHSFVSLFKVDYSTRLLP